MKNMNFSNLYRQYRMAPLGSGKKFEIYKRMVKAARSFNDWAIVYRYGDNSYQYLAEEHMKAKVLKGKTSLDVRRNILKLFDLVTDENEQNEILKAFLLKYHSRDDLRFVSEFSLSLVIEFSDLSVDEIEEIIDEQEKRLLKVACWCLRGRMIVRSLFWCFIIYCIYYSKN